jgi:hypothetical protein
MKMCFVFVVSFCAFVSTVYAQEKKEERSLRELREVTMTGSNYLLEYNKPGGQTDPGQGLWFVRACEGLDPNAVVLTGVSVAGEKVTITLLPKKDAKREKIPALKFMRLKERDKAVTIYGAEYSEAVTPADEPRILKCFIDLDVLERGDIKGWLPADPKKRKAEFLRDPDDAKKKGNIKITYTYDK